MNVSKSVRKRFLVGHIFFIIIGVIVIGLFIALLVDEAERKELRALTIEYVDITKLKDGIYIGEYNGTKGHFRDAMVEATVLEGKIVAINIRKGAIDKDGKPTKLSENKTIEDLFDNVIESQSLLVDGISGATLTSKSHLKALENALKEQ